MRYSNHCKIIDLNSEYYGQVFKVKKINIGLEFVEIKLQTQSYTADFDFSQIQFCVTKDNEPVKIGEEYVCIGDNIDDNEIIDFAFHHGDTQVIYKNGFDVISILQTSTISILYPLHPTNKIKITAEKIEELDWNAGVDSYVQLRNLNKKLNELVQAVNNLQTQQTNNIGIK